MIKELYKNQTKCLVALDSIIFGFDGSQLKLLLVKRGVDDDSETWSLMGGWLQPTESLDEAASRILFELTGLSDIYLEQLSTFGNPDRDPLGRTVSVAYKALINIGDYSQSISDKFQAEWFSLYNLPTLLFDHAEMIELAIAKLRMNAAIHPTGFELLPEKFTLPELQTLYEAIFDTTFDKRNFSRKILSTGYLIKSEEKQRGVSKKGAFYYILDKQKYKESTQYGFQFISNKDTIL